MGKISLLLLLLLVTLPLELQAQAGGLITCDGTTCGSCEFVELINNLIKLLFGLVSVVFAVMMAIAGIGLVTSGGSPGALEAAKSKLSNALIGLVIMLAAWLLVDTIMKALLPGGNITVSGNLFWADVSCTTQTPTRPPTQPSVPPTTPAPSACPVPPLSPITDPIALQMENGNTLIWSNPQLKQCVDKLRTILPSANPTSAFRPQAYQTHLWEIKNRWCDLDLRSNSDPLCSGLKTQVQSEVAKHFGTNWNCGAVARTNSTHSSGNGVDLTGINHGSPTVVAATRGVCLQWRNYANDPYHYDLNMNIPGCSCN